MQFVICNTRTYKYRKGGYNLHVIINALFNHGQMFQMMPNARTIFSRLFHTRYILVVSIGSWNVEKESSGPQLESKFRLSVKNNTSVQKKRESLSGYLLVCAVSIRSYTHS